MRPHPELQVSLEEDLLGTSTIILVLGSGGGNGPGNGPIGLATNVGHTDDFCEKASNGVKTRSQDARECSL